MSEEPEQPEGTEGDTPSAPEPAAEPEAATEPDAKPEPEAEPEPAVTPARRRSARAIAARRRRRRAPSLRFRITSVLLAVGAVIGLAGGLWSVPTVRTQLLDSFTERGSSFTELYFTADPTFDGAVVLVPLAVTDHGTGAKSYRITVTLESRDGSVAATSTVSLVPKDGTAVPTVVRMQSNGNVAAVRVTLAGHPQTLHFHLGKQPTTNP
ncbi:hypothetical protein [Kitasatospora azatica]|uniref:hypothetical protein n=1 Tax=Kitasatospora azatica TaxID=58347 RepID=UPI0005670152|nr:hypothetical protein [Kitasatospora azatica]